MRKSPAYPPRALILALCALVLACTDDPLDGRLGAVCATKLALYEQATRPIVSPVTGVDTSKAEIAAPSRCCLVFPNTEDDLDWPTIAWPVSEGRVISSLSPSATKYPWTAPCRDSGACDTCNLCPYGVQALQGTWIDFDQAADLDRPSFIVPMHGDESNLLEIDGNTFRWRVVNRVSGERLDARGFYYCPSDERVFVATSMERFSGTTCPLRYPMPNHHMSPPVPRDWWSDVDIGFTVPLAIGSNPDAKGIHHAWPYLIEMDFSRYETEMPTYCHPGTYVGTLVPPNEPTLAIPFTCPDASTFFDCW